MRGHAPLYALACLPAGSARPTPSSLHPLPPPQCIPTPLLHPAPPPSGSVQLHSTLTRPQLDELMVPELCQVRAQRRLTAEDEALAALLVQRCEADALQGGPRRARARGEGGGNVR